MPDTGKNIDEAKRKAIEALAKRIHEMGEAAYSIMLKEIEEIFDFKEGKIIADKAFVKQLNKLTIEVLDLLQSDPKFTGPVSAFVKRFESISKEIGSFQKSVNNINVPAFEAEKKIVIDETLDQMLNNGLNQNFAQPLRSLIYQNVSAKGLSLTEAREHIKEYIEGGKDESGKLERYIEQTAQQAVDSYSGAINKKIMETFDMNGLLQTGSLIDTSSPQCRYVTEELGGKLTRDKWPEFERIGKKHGLLPGTTFDNLPLNLAHFGCRHGWYPVIIKKEKND